MWEPGRTDGGRHGHGRGYAADHLFQDSRRGLGLRRHSHRLGLEGRQWPADVIAIVAMDNQDFEDDVDLALDAGQSYANGTIAPLCANSFVSGEPLS